MLPDFITVEMAEKALDNLDDFARMEVGVGAQGPRETLAAFIAQVKNQAPSTLLPNAPAGKYTEVLIPFMALMEAELHANSSKGDRPGWLAMTPSAALLEIYGHTAKLSAAVKNWDRIKIKEHSVDVANMAMMLLDVCTDLTATPDNQPKEPK